jgi:hypothetical protein
VVPSSGCGEEESVVVVVVSFSLESVFCVEIYNTDGAK